MKSIKVQAFFDILKVAGLWAAIFFSVPYIIDMIGITFFFGGLMATIFGYLLYTMFKIRCSMIESERERNKN
jgi:hypothetical protein